MDNLHISIEDQKYKSILYIVDLLKWNSQSGEHFESRPGYNIRPYVTIILYILNIYADKLLIKLISHHPFLIDFLFLFSAY